MCVYEREKERDLHHFSNGIHNPMLYKYIDELLLNYTVDDIKHGSVIYSVECY